MSNPNSPVSSVALVNCTRLYPNGEQGAGQATEVVKLFEPWYPLPKHIPDELKNIIYDYVFNPLEEDWWYAHPGTVGMGWI
jgi:hypothetical protein